MKAVGKVYETSDYSLFRKKMGNREVDNDHVQKLMARMQASLLPLPIIVTKIGSEYEIDDGQHTMYSRRNLGLPILFIVTNELQEGGMTLKNVQSLNGSRDSWTSQQYLDSFCQLKDKKYIRFREFCTECDVSIENALILTGCDNSSRALDLFRDGDLPVVTEESYKTAKDRADKIHAIHAFFGKAWNRNFVRALCQMLSIPQFDFNDLLRNLGRKPTLLEPQVSVFKYKVAINDAFNFGKHNKIYLLASDN